MLVISRKPNEKLKIGDNVEIAVLEISGSRVVLGIAAPREVAVRRVGAEAAEAEMATAVMGNVVRLEIPTAPSSESAHQVTPFEYPARAVQESGERRMKAPVVTVRRSRKFAMPTDDGLR